METNSTGLLSDIIKNLQRNVIWQDEKLEMWFSSVKKYNFMYTREI
jgi:hypothetical protein